MKLFGESWCFCSGPGRSEKIKGSILSGKGSALAVVCGGIGFLIHKNLLLTTHANLPSVAAALVAEVQFQNGVVGRLFPHRFFITSPVLDLTIVGVDIIDGSSINQTHRISYLKVCSNPSLELGNTIYVLSHSDKKELTIGQAKVVIATDNLIKLSTEGFCCRAGSAGFDAQGNLAFIICDPLKLASVPAIGSSTLSSPSCDKSFSMQFGIPIPIICDWLNQHWEGSLDEFSKSRLPLIRLMSSGQRNEFSSASLCQRRIFRSLPDDKRDPSLSTSRAHGSLGNAHGSGNHTLTEAGLTEEQGVATPDIFESPRLPGLPAGRSHGLQLLDIKFPSSALKGSSPSLSPGEFIPSTGENVVGMVPSKLLRVEVSEEIDTSNRGNEADASLTGECTVAESEIHSSLSPVGMSDGSRFHTVSSEDETMYSAETMESRNYPSPKKDRLQQVGRSQSCLSYAGSGGSWGRSAVRRCSLGNEKNLPVERRICPESVMLQKAKSHDYFSPTVSSIMKKQNNVGQLHSRSRQNRSRSSMRWNF